MILLFKSLVPASIPLQTEIAGPAASLIWDTTWGSRTLLSARAEREIAESTPASRAAAAAQASALGLRL
eukprot:456489-Pelagomonas_calceolata.AAC.3